jgi:hypothetical protein
MARSLFSWLSPQRSLSPSQEIEALDFTRRKLLATKSRQFLPFAYSAA